MPPPFLGPISAASPIEYTSHLRNSTGCCTQRHLVQRRSISCRAIIKVLVSQDVLSLHLKTYISKQSELITLGSTQKKEGNKKEKGKKGYHTNSPSPSSTLSNPTKYRIPAH